MTNGLIADIRQQTDKQRARYDVQVRVSSLDGFANLRKVIISFVVSVCPFVHPSVRMEQLGSHWTDSHETLYLNIFRKICL